ncbi:RWD-domain-containing protein [Ophiobolus disseminans]|uniref:RBR-type E3 ubiquitin transferase n=1 Tax=Ophiobolus disseminans TaxID=1469910 RepID=A0A6A6ZZ68_9PLEO|nr:RWD-domain-containing protein [Ophiobolus disseminans]
MEDTELDDERAVELSTLQSIYPELIIDANDPYCAALDVLVAPSTPLPVTFEPDQDVQRLSYLPSLHIEINLPTTYPAEISPSIKLSTTPRWLPLDVSQKLVDEAKSLWEEYGGGTVLFSYVSSLQEQAETAFGLEELTLPSNIRQELVAYSKKLKRELFDKETFDCEVCLEPKKGSACYRMERCSHVFCVACLQDYYNNCIKEGDVNNVKCMSTECGKSGGSKRKKDWLLSPKELLQIPMDRETVERFAKIKRKKKIESDPTIIYCPRTWCQGAMRTDKYPKITDVTQMDDSDSEAEEDVTIEQDGANIDDGVKKRSIGRQDMERLAVCEDCNLAFCIVCLASWHGDFVRCEPRDLNQLTEEDQASLNFILKSTSPCPYCSVPCQKSYGCNHMTCAQCETHFCYLCGSWLNPDHPYQHYNDPKFKHCFQRLMDGAEGEEGVQFGGRRGAEQAAEFWEQEAMRIQLQLNEEDTV